MPGRGYRFVAALDEVSKAAALTVPSVRAGAVPAPDPPPPDGAGRRRHGPAAIAIGPVLMAVIAVTVYALWPSRGHDPGEGTVRVAVLPFENLSGDPERDYLADGLTEGTIASLGQLGADSIKVKGRTSAMA